MMSHRKKSIQETIPIDWLLSGPAYVRYRTLIDILGSPLDSNEVRTVQSNIVQDSTVLRLLDRRNADGYWGAADEIFKWWPKKDSTFWVLGVLSDFGLTRDDAGIDRACEYVFGTQLPCGAFGLRPSSKAYECFTGVLVSALAGLGYIGDIRLEQSYQWIAERQRSDGGFWCKDTGQTGERRESEPSCALASLWILQALSRHPKYRESTVCNRCTDFLLRCWDNRGRIKYAGHDSQIGTGWEKLKYPFTDYRILHFFYTLSPIRPMKKDKRLLRIAELLMSKRDGEGRFRPESIHTAWSDFDFGQKQVPSMWLTCLIYGAVSRFFGTSLDPSSGLKS